MEFFCAKCQRKHEVSEIAADIWSICKEDVNACLSNISSEMDAHRPEHGEDKIVYRKFRNLVSESRDAEDVKTTINGFHAYLIKFINENPKVAFEFMMRGSEIKEYLTDAQIVESTVTGNMCISLGRIIELYRQYGARTTSEDEFYNKYLDIITDDILRENIYEKRMTFYYNKVRFQDEVDYVLERGTDENNVPFAMGGEMLGFVRTCPYCGSRVSQAVGRAPEIVIALAGGPRAGKTSCLTALTSALSSGKYAEYDLGIQAMQHDKLWKRLSEEIQLYQKCVKVTKTATDQNEVSSYSVLVRFGRQNRVLTFVDMPGEFWESGSGLSPAFFQQYSGLYQSIDCIWFVASKLSVYEFDLGTPGRQSELQELLAKQTSESSTLIEQSRPSNLDANFRTLRSQLVAWGKDMPPVAVIISKPDVCTGDEDKNSVKQYNLFPIDGDVPSVNLSDLMNVLQRDRSGQYYLREKRFYDCGMNVRKFVYKKNNALFRAIEDNCPDRFYISMAAYGCPAADAADKAQNGPKPFHEMFPLIWTLAVTGVLGIAHQCVWRDYDIFKNFKSATNGAEKVVFDYRVVPNTSKRDKEKKIIFDDVASNLLMRSKSYKISEFEH